MRRPYFRLPPEAVGCGILGTPAAERSGTCYGSGKSGLTLRPYEFAWGSGNQPASSAGAPGRPPPSVQKGKVVRFAFRFAAVRKEMV